MPLPINTGRTSVILQKIKTTASDLMQDFLVEGSATDKVWESILSWNVHNRLSVAWTEYPAVFIVIPKLSDMGFAIQRKRKWDVTLQIEFYFAEYDDEEDEEYGMYCIEEVSRMCRLNPTMGATQPNPDKFKILDWVMTDANVEYFIDDNQLMMGIVCSTVVSLIDCRGG